MDEYQNIVSTLSLTLGASWASGINLYAVILVLGLAANFGGLALPAGLELLTHPLVLTAAGIMYAVEFVADKIPLVDSGWDAIHTFIRIPAGAMLATGAMGGDSSVAMNVAAGLLGGGMATISHATKAGSRVLINTSPEPASNWGASLTEDIAVFGGLWAALNHPWLFLGILVLFLLFVAWLLPKIWRGIKKVFQFIGRLFGGGAKSDVSAS